MREIVRAIEAKPGVRIYCDEHFRFIRQSAPEQYPWDAIYWELWLKAVTNFFVFFGQRTNALPSPVLSKRHLLAYFILERCAPDASLNSHVCIKCGSKHPAAQCSLSEPKGNLVKANISNVASKVHP